MPSMHSITRYGGSRLLLDVVDADDMFVLDGRGGPGLADESFAGRAVGRIGGSKHLDGDDAMQLLVEALSTMPKPPLPSMVCTS